MSGVDGGEQQAALRRLSKVDDSGGVYYMYVHLRSESRGLIWNAVRYS